MQWTVREAAELLQVTEEIVHRWIRLRGLPAAKCGDQIRVNQVELVEWAHCQQIPLHESPTSSTPRALPSLHEALTAGGIHRLVPGETKREVLRAAVERLRLPSEVDRGPLLETLLAREDEGSTGFGNGIAIPHVRNPVVLSIRRPVVTLCFLSKPVEYQAIDDEPVFALFLLVNPTVRMHLHLLSRLASLLRSPSLLERLTARAPDEVILGEIASLESSLGPAGTRGETSG